MAITKTIEVDGKNVTFRASAMIPRLYRLKFRRDIYSDMRKLMKGFDAEKKDDNGELSDMEIENLEIFENVAYIMAKHGDPDNVPNDPDEWLESFNTFSIYMILPSLIELWGLNTEQQVESKKKFEQLKDK